MLCIGFICLKCVEFKKNSSLVLPENRCEPRFHKIEEVTQGRLPDNGDMSNTSERHSTIAWTIAALHLLAGGSVRDLRQRLWCVTWCWESSAFFTLECSRVGWVIVSLLVKPFACTVYCNSEWAYYFRNWTSLFSPSAKEHPFPSCVSSQTSHPVPFHKSQTRCERR